MQAAEAQLAEAQSRAQMAKSVARRYGGPARKGFVSQEAADAKAHEANAAQAAPMPPRATRGGAKDQERTRATSRASASTACSPAR